MNFHYTKVYYTGPISVTQQALKVTSFTLPYNDEYH